MELLATRKREAFRYNDDICRHIRSHDCVSSQAMASQKGVRETFDDFLNAPMDIVMIATGHTVQEVADAAGGADA